MIKWFEEHDKISLSITLLLASFIFYMSSKIFEVPSYTASWISFVYHISVFATLNFFLMISILRGREDYVLFFTCMLLAIIYGAGDELHQYFVPGRTCALDDVCLDSVGVLLSSMFYLIFLKFRK